MAVAQWDHQCSGDCRRRHQKSYLDGAADLVVGEVREAAIGVVDEEDLSGACKSAHCRDIQAFFRPVP